MKFTKTAAALALAGIAASPLAQADGHEGGGPVVTLSGYLGIGIVGSDADDIVASDAVEEVLDAAGVVVVEAADAVEASEPGNLKMFGDDSTINLRASQTLNNGMEGYANYRTDFALSGDAGKGDNIHLGMKGDFGDIRIGEVPDAIEYGQMAGDIMKDIGGEERGISYTGTFGGATIGLNWSPVGTLNGDNAGGGSDKIGIGAKFSAGGFGIGVGVGDVNEATVMSVGASYSISGVSLALAFKDDDAEQYLSAKAGWSLGAVSMGLTYEGMQDVGDDTKIRFDAGYDLGDGYRISTRVNMLDADTDVTDYRLLLSADF